MNIARLLDSTFNDAVKALTMGTSQSALVRARERAYIKTLIRHLQREFAGEDLRVFASPQHGNAADFGTNRLLYDIAVCQIGAGTSAERKPEDFLYIADALWQIEVDFSREWRLAIQAINRLNCGAGSNRLLITSIWAQGSERLLDTLREPAAAGGGMYLALVSHPADWDDDTSPPQVWRVDDDKWSELT